MAAHEVVFLDTSTLLTGLVDLGATSDAPQNLMAAVAERRIRRASTAWHCCLEFYSVATRLPPEYRLRPEDAFLLLDHEILARLTIHDMPSDVRRSFLRELSAEGIAGGRVYDGHIAEVARRARAGVVVTENQRHFQGLARHGIRVVSAAEFLGRA